MKIKLLATAMAVAVAAAANGQQPEELPPRPSPPVEGQVRFATMEEPFADPGNHTAETFARHAGIPVAEAGRQLRLATKASHVARRLERENPSEFAGLEVEMGQSFRAKAYLKGSSESASARVRGAAMDPELAPNLTAHGTQRSRREIRQEGRELEAALARLGITANVAVSAPRNSIVLLVRDVDALERAVAAGALTLPDHVTYEQFSGIIPTAYISGGSAYNGDPYGLDPGKGCTTGFVVVRPSDYTRGATTAGHCSDPGKFSTNLSSNWDSLGQIPLRTQQQWTANDVDLQWMRSTSSDVYPADFWNGSMWVNVTGGADDLPGEWVCKFGRSTRETCGYIDGYEYSSGTYGYFPRVNRNSTYTRMNEDGDSGGPVYKGSLAVGWVHGRDGSYNLYFTPIRAVSRAGIDLKVVITN